MTNENLDKLRRYLQESSFSKEVRKKLAKEYSYNPVPIRRKETSLRDYQLECLLWATKIEKSKNSLGLRGGIVSFTQGLGKTLFGYTLSFARPRGSWPTLVICSKTVLNEWKAEFEKHFGGEKSGKKVLYFHPDFEDVKNLEREDISKYHIVVSTYDLVRMSYDRRDISTYAEPTYQSVLSRKFRGKDLLFSVPWHRCIFDESHNIANSENITWKAVVSLYSKYTWCFTATWFRNHINDLWSQLRCCGYEGCSKKSWEEESDYYIQKHCISDYIFNINYEKAGVVLPEKKEKTIRYELEGKEKELYDTILTETRRVFTRSAVDRSVNYGDVLAMYSFLMQSVLAGYLLDPNSKRKKKDTIYNLNLESKLVSWLRNIEGTAGYQSTRIQLLISSFRTLKKGEKILVFSRFTSFLDLLAGACRKYLPELSFVQIDGGVKGKNRQDLIESFKNDKNIEAVFATYKVCSEGMNFPQATRVYCVEPWWSPTVQDQTIRRAWRVGQKNIVTVYNYIASGTVEERILEVLENKKEMKTGTFSSNKSTSSRKILSKILSK